MNKKLLIASIVTVGVLTLVANASINELGLGFRAPWVTSTSDVTNPVNGEIVYDYDDGVFYGYFGSTTGWDNISPSAQDQIQFSSTKTSNYSAVATDDYIFGDSSSGAFTITLPATSGLTTGQEFFIKKESSDANAITIATNGSELIDGSASTTINTNGETLHVAFDGTNFELVNRRIPSKWVNFTPTSAWSGNVSLYGQWRRVGDSMEIQYSIEGITGFNSTGSFYFAMVPNYTIDTSKLSTTVTYGWTVGHGSILNSATTVWLATAVLSGSNFYMYSGRTSAADNNVDHNNPFTFGPGDLITLRVTVPISGWNE